jgi:hypothetical protein
LRVRLAGIPFDVGPEERLCAEERSSLETIRTFPRLPGSHDLGFGEACRISIELEPSWTGDEGVAATDTPAEVSALGDLVRVGETRFRAELRPHAGTGSLFRSSTTASALDTTLRVLLSCRLPLVGALPLHAAGVALEGGGAAFYGVSGAGKSTLVGFCVDPILSDERVVVATGERGYELASSGYWGNLRVRYAPQGFIPLKALFQLRQAPELRVERLSAAEAFVSLLPVVMIPDSQPLWAAAVAVLGRLVESVPVYRLGWSLSRPPWDEIRAIVAAA